MIINGIKHCPPSCLDVALPNHRQNSRFYEWSKMLIIREIDNLLVKVALPRTQDTTQDRPAYIVFNIDGGLKEGAEGTTYCRAMLLQVFICGYSLY